MIRLILDTDIGNGVAGANTDDGLALALALCSSEIKLEMLTCVSGNVPNIIAYSVAKKLFEKLNLNIPVFLGANEALMENSKPWRKRLDESVKEFGLEYLWQDFEKIKIYENISPNAPLKMGELVTKNPKQISICAIGPLTNVAIAMKLFKDFDLNVKEIFIMGGSFDMAGFSKDTNFGFDPESASIVLNSRAKITLVPYNITMQTLLQEKDLKDFENKNLLCDFLYKSLNVWIKYAKQTRGTDGTWIHDALTIAYMLDSTLAKFDEYYADVICDSSLSRGASWRLAKEVKMSLGIDLNEKNLIRILRDVDNDKLLKLIKTKILNGICYENYKNITT